MINFLFCLFNLIISIIIIIIIIYLCGRIYPREWIKERKFPFKSFFIENKGRIYERIGIKRWKTKLPDASIVMNKIFKKWIPKKRIESVNNIKTLIKETCVAEMTHFISILAGFICPIIWKSLGGVIISLVYMIINIPFIIIQRYNRPRLIEVYDKRIARDRKDN